MFLKFNKFSINENISFTIKENLIDTEIETKLKFNILKCG